MKKSNLKQIFLTLALLITAATGAWAADGEKYTVQFKANGKSVTMENVTLPYTFSCDNNNANGELDIILKALYGWTGNSDQTYCDADNAPSSDDTSKATAGNAGYCNHYITISNAFEGTVNVAGTYYVNYSVTSYSLEISISVVEPPLMTLDETNTEATMEMPASDVSVEYSLVRDLTQQVTFGGIPTGDGLVVKNNGTAYEFVTAPAFTLTDALADNADIISDEGITVTTQKKGDGDTWTTLDASALAAGFAPGTYRLVATANADGPYDGTIYSAEFTTVEKYDLAIQPADEYSKDKLSEVTVAGTAQTLDADGKATVTNVAPGAEVKLKANRGYVIEKVEAKKKVPAEGHDFTASAVGEIVGSDGKAYAAADKDNLPKGVTAVAMIAYVGNASDCTNGLAIALADESGTMTWSAAGTACSGKTAVTGGTWRLPSIIDWQNMFIGCGASGEVKDNPDENISYSELASKLSTAGGTAFQSANYWASTEMEPGSLAWCVDFSLSIFNGYTEIDNFYVRAVLAF